MGLPFVRNIFVEGLFARFMYRASRLMHERAVGGTSYAVLSLVARALARRTGAPLKLHRCCRV
jgi:NADH dehydrogenase